jgi:hypothetical protein
MFVRLTNVENLLNITDSECGGDKQGVLYVLLISFVSEADVQCLEQLIVSADQ